MTDPATSLRRIDAAIHYTGLAGRAVAYLLVGGLASHYSCGVAILTGLFVGDVAATAAGLVLQPREHLLQGIAELLLLGLVFLWARGDLAWPADPANRAIVTLAALGVFAGRTGGGMLTRFGADDGFA